MKEKDNTEKIKKIILLTAISCGIIVICLIFVIMISIYKEKAGPQGIYIMSGDYYLPDSLGLPDQKLDTDFGEITISRNDSSQDP